MRKLLLLFALLLPALTQVQTARYFQWCQTGAQPITTVGTNSTTVAQASMPACTVTVFLHGTAVKATIYSDSSNTPLTNPFTANSDATYGFYAAVSAHYDIVTEGQIQTITGPQTETVNINDVVLGGGGGGGGGSVSITGTPPINVTPNPLTNTGVVSHAASGVTPGTYTNATLTVDAFGHITSAESGAGISNESVTFTNVPSATITSTFANANIGWSCFDQNGIELIPSYVDVAAFPTITFNFVSLQSGTCNAIGNGGSGGGGSTPGAPLNSCQYNVGGTGLGGALGCIVTPVAASVNPALLAQDNTQNVVTVTSDFQNWTACASGCTYTITSPTAITAGANTLIFATVPVGVSGTDTVAAFRGHYLAIIPAAGDTSPVEYFPITGGTAVGGSTAGGTITFSAAYSHLAGYTIVSATTGISEAVSYATQLSSAFIGCGFQLDPTQIYLISAPAYIFCANKQIVFDGKGATIQCAVFADCITLYSTSTDFYHVTFQPTNPSPPWDVTPSSPASIPGNAATATLTIPTCPANFYAAIPGQKLWLAGASGGMVTGVFEGIGEYVFTVSGGTCVPGLTNGTIAITQGSPYVIHPVATLSPHGAGYTLSSNVGSYLVDGGNFNVHMHDLRFASNGTGNGLGNEIEVWQDQSCAIDNIMMDTGYVTRIDTDYQSAGIFNAVAGAICYVGPAVNISEPAKCVEWDGGNDFHWGTGVCQAFRTGGVVIRHRLGAFGTDDVGPNVHFEIGAQAPPWFGGAILGNPPILVSAGTAPFHFYGTLGGGIPFGSNAAPYATFLPTLTSQTAVQYYYIAAHNNSSTFYTCTSSDCIGTPFFIGATLNTNPASNPVTVNWFAQGDNSVGTCCTVNSYDLLRVGVSSTSIGQPFPQAPIGTGTYLVASGLVPSSTCNTHGICTFTDNVAPGSLSSYTVNSSGNAHAWDVPISFGGGQIALLEGATYKGPPTCINSQAYFNGQVGQVNFFNNDVAVFTAAALSENDITSLCPQIIAPVSSQGLAGFCAGTSSSLGALNCNQSSSAGEGFSRIHMTIYPGRTTATVTTSAVTSWSTFEVQDDLGVAKLLSGVTCDTVTHGPYTINPTAGTGFTITAASAPTNSGCITVKIKND